MPEDFIAKAEISIAAPLETVWEALTKPELVKQYLFGTDMQTDWTVGGPITYSGVWEGKPYQDKGVVKEFVPEKRIAMTYWSPASGLPDTPENYKTVEYDLQPSGNATRVTITQDHNATADEAKHSEKNWNVVLEGMKKLLEKKN